MTARRRAPHDTAGLPAAARRAHGRNEGYGEPVGTIDGTSTSGGMSGSGRARDEVGVDLHPREPLSRQRGERSRRRIAEALIALLGEDGCPPTALQVANR